MSFAPQTTFSLRDVSRLFSLRESRLRYWAQTGFVNPKGKSKGRRAYTFTDLLEIKAAKELLDAGIPLQRVRRNLQALRHALPDEPNPLLRISCDGETVHVTEGKSNYNPISGQMLMDFDIGTLKQQIADILELHDPRNLPKSQTTRRHSKVATLVKPHLPSSEPRELLQAETPQTTTPLVDPAAGEISAYGWFLRGSTAHDAPGQEEQAIAAYCKAIQLDPGLAAAHTNLGNLHYRLEQHDQALIHYQQACTLDPDQPEAHYNLGNIYDEQANADSAIAEYRKAVSLCPDFADAHFNLARTLEQVGSRVQACDHWQRYLQLTEDDGEAHAWRAIAEQRLTHISRP